MGMSNDKASIGGYCLMVEFQFEKMKKVLETNCVVCTTERHKTTILTILLKQ
jgi:hypothetical protein